MKFSFFKNIFEKVKERFTEAKYEEELGVGLDKLLPNIHFGLTLFKYKPIRIALYNLVVLSLIMLAIQIYYLLTNINLSFWLKYLGPAAVNIALMGGTTVAFKIYSLGKPLMNYQEFQLNNLGENIRQKILKIAKFQRFAFYIHVVLEYAFVFVTLAHWNKYRGNICILSLFIEDYFPNYSTFLNYFVYICYFIGGIPYALPAYNLLYLYDNSLYQTYLLIEHIQNVSSSLKNLNECDANYLKVVNNELIFIIKQHQNILKYYNHIWDALGYWTLFYYFIAMLVMIYPLSGILSEFKDFPTTGIGLVTFYSWAVFFCYQSQQLEDASFELLQVISNMAWYKWNISILRNYHILLMNVKILQIRLAPFLIINCDYLKQIIKFCYSIISIANTMQNRTTP